MSRDVRGAALAPEVDAVLREFVNALGKATMYPAGHRFIAESNASLLGRIESAIVHTGSLTISILPRGIAVDGVLTEPLPVLLREFAVRMHRKNVAVISLQRAISGDEVAAVLTALAAGDADEQVGRNGLRLDHARIEPVSYEVLTLAGASPETAIDEEFWSTLAEAALDRRSAAEGGTPSVAELAEAISERAARGSEGARRVYEALSGFAAALTGRSDLRSSAARQRFVELLATLSPPTTTRVVAAAPSPASRRRFLTDTLELLPPGLLLQLLESVAEADGAVISPQLHALLAKLAGSEGSGDGGFVLQVLWLVQQWDGGGELPDEETDARVGVDPYRVLAIGLQVGVASSGVLASARTMLSGDRIGDALALLDDPRNDLRAAREISDAVLDAGLIAQLLAQPALDFPLIERIAVGLGPTGVGILLDALGNATERLVRRKLLDILVRIGPAAEATLLARLEGAPWYLARNILAVLGHFPAIANVEPVFLAFAEPELRVRQEALKVLVRQPRARERAISQALATGEESLARMALTALGNDCPSSLVVPVLAALDRPETDLQLLAIRVVAESSDPAVMPRLLACVATRRGLFRRLRLRPRTPAMLAALEVVSRRWGKQGPAASIRTLAAGSSDPDVRAAAGAAS